MVALGIIGHADSRHYLRQYCAVLCRPVNQAATTWGPNSLDSAMMVRDHPHSRIY